MNEVCSNVGGGRDGIFDYVYNSVIMAEVNDIQIENSWRVFSISLILVNLVKPILVKVLVKIFAIFLKMV